jgi:formylglycine-generating enzyme required for sulfatase activity
MVLVTKDDLDKDPATFYIMETKVWNDLYAKFDSDPKYKAKLPSEINQWKQGGNDAKSGKPLGEEIGALNGQFPVYRVTVTQAYFFAQWLGEDGLDSDTECKLPNRKQWMKAAGFPGAEKAGPFRGTIDDLDDVAVMGSPREVGKSERDQVDKTGCRDMAGNGYEWTCDVLIPEGMTVPLDAAEREEAKVLVMGQSYTTRKPLTYKDVENILVPKDYAKAHWDTSFRVILVRRSGPK